MAELYQVTSKSGLNLRKVPQDGSIITSVAYDDIVEKLGESNFPDWWQVRVCAGRNVEAGFVNSKFLFAYDPKPRKSLFSGSLETNFDKILQFIGDFAHRYPMTLLPVLNEIVDEYEINKNPKRFCHFMAQIAHETSHFAALEENLWFSADGLVRLFPNHFDNLDHAREFARQPEKIANRIYANRKGNGDEASGDGYRFRGRGFLMLTGRENYRRIGDRANLDLEHDPDMITRDLAVAVRVAASYWDSRNLNHAADQDDLEAVTRAVSGGYRGLSDRKTLLKRARAIWG